MSVDDSLLRNRVRPKLGVLEQIDAAAAEAERERELEGDLQSAEKLSPLPRPGDPYKAHGRPTVKPQPTLRFLLANAAARGIPFANLDAIDWLPGEAPGDGPVLVIRFDGLKPTEVTLEGRRLDGLYDLISHHKVGWVRELGTARDFLEGSEPVITRITFRPFAPNQR